MKGNKKLEDTEAKKTYNEGYEQGTRDAMKIVLKKFCEVECGEVCEDPNCIVFLDFRDSIKETINT